MLTKQNQHKINSNKPNQHQFNSQETKWAYCPFLSPMQGVYKQQRGVYGPNMGE